MEIVRYGSTRLALLLAAILLVGCGDGSQDSNSNAAAKTPNKAASTPSAPPGEERDLSALDVCARLTIAAVAEIMGSTAERTSGKATMATHATDCTYTIERDEGARDYAMVWLYAPQMWEPATAGEDEEITGLGDEAYLTQGSGSFQRVHVLVKDDFMLDTRADSPEQARKLAELAIERLTGNGGD